MEEKITDRVRNRFWKRVQKSDEPDGCWLYVSKSKQKSHIFFITCNHCRSEYYATRVAKFISGCEVNGKLVYRTCDTPNCVNPDHLKVGDHNDVAQMNKEKGIMPGPKKKPIEVRPVSFVVRFD
jgi:hypothetical protein